MTPAQIETMSRRLLNSESSKFWSQDEIITELLYECATQLSIETECIENRYSTDSVAGQQEYSQPERAIQLKRVTYDGNKLKKISFRELDSIDLNTDTTVTGTPAYYAIFDETVFLHPAPDTSSLTIKMQTIDQPSRPDINSILEIPSRYHTKLAMGVAYLMSMKELGHPNTSRLEGLWFKAIEDVKEMEKKRKRGDGFKVVLTEENAMVDRLGVV